MSLSRLLGTYFVATEPVLVVEREGGVALSALGVPDEFAAPLVEEGDGFRVEGGPLAGAEVAFADGDPCPGGVFDPCGGSLCLPLTRGGRRPASGRPRAAPAAARALA